MKQYIVEVTNDAAQDMNDIYKYIAFTLLSPIVARKQYDRIANVILSLDLFPERNIVIEYKLENNIKLRRVLVDNYSVFYIIKENKVIVTNVLYTSSDIDRRLLNE
ncbi:MAG: type II toxin-antitoxin system RelE/ParE family toxin [Coprobacillaceae bacterium]